MSKSKSMNRKNGAVRSYDVISCDVILRERVRDAIDIEPELPGAMPKEIWDMLRSDERAAAEVMRANVRAMKNNIKARLGL